MSEDKYDKITLEDVEIAISILQHYIRTMQRAKMVLNQFQSIGGFGAMQKSINPFNFTFEDFVRMAVELDRRKRGLPPSDEEKELPIGELSEEEIKRMKETVRKIRSKEINKEVNKEVNK